MKIGGKGITEQRMHLDEFGLVAGKILKESI